MLTCKQLVTHLNNTFPDKNFKMKLSVKLHLLMCKHCSAYVKQMDILTQTLKVLINSRESSVNEPKTQDIQEKILNHLKSLK